MAMGVKKSYRKTLIKYIAELIYCEIGGNMDEYEKLLKPVITVDNVTVGEPISDELKQSIYDMIDRNDVEHCYIDMKRAATFATRDVEDETHQAMEAMMHNLNTMHCLVYWERIPVYDNLENKNKVITVQELYDTFLPGRYLAISVNMKTGKIEKKLILEIKKKDNHRDCVMLSFYEDGRKRSVTCTTNHKLISYSEKRGLFKDTYDHIDTLVYMNDNDKVFRTAKIDDIQVFNTGEDYVYDIAVKDNENFVVDSGIFVSNSRAGAQVPFSSLNYGTDTSPEGRLVMKSLLEVTFEGLGNGETPIFPIQIFKVKEGINYNPEDPNYDLFQLAMKVSAKRLFPNFSFMDAPYNLKYYKERDPDTETGYMGAVSGDCVVLYESEGDGCISSNRFDAVYEELAEKYGELDIGISKYVDLEPYNFMVMDTNAGGFVKAKKIIKNPNLRNWYRVDVLCDNDIVSFYMTEDHPLPIFGNGRLMIKDMFYYYLVKGITPRYRVASSISKGKYLEIVDIKQTDDYDGYGYDFETVSDRFNVWPPDYAPGSGCGINSHNCRTRVIANVVDKDREITPGRGNLSFTSVNLPRLAIEAHGDLDKFFESLKDMVNLVIDQLLERFRFQCTKKVYNYPFMMGEGVWIDSEKLESTDSVAEVLKHGTLTCGFIGLAETLKCLIGKHHGESEEAQQLGLRIIKFMRTLMDNACEEHKLNFSLIATPERSGHL